MSRLLTEHDAGWVAPPGDAKALARCLREALERPDAKEQGARALLADFSWDRVLAPLVGFCLRPRRDGTKEHFTHRPQTVAPSDALSFRLRRRLRVWRRWA